MRYQNKNTLVALVLWVVASTATAQLTAVVAVEPTAKTAANTIARSSMESGLSQAVGQAVSVSTSDDLTNIMRATRTGDHAIFIGPAQVAASALQRGYELVGATQKSVKYVLVGRSKVDQLSAMKGGRLYLPQQDSVYTYMARGMLNQAGLSFKDLKSVHYGKYPDAGLAALVLGTTDATVVSESVWADWSAQHPGVARLLATSQPVPGGFSVVVSQALPQEQRTRIAKWFTTQSGSTGLPVATVQPAAGEYQRVAELGFFTPTTLPGVQVVTAEDVRKLQAQGALMVDTRTEKEFQTKRVKGALHAAYVEKSLKDVVFDVSLDDFSALARVPGLGPDKAVIFACNGAECWKSYKAAKDAKSKGFKNVYWFRGGLPEWVATGLPTESN